MPTITDYDTPDDLDAASTPAAAADAPDPAVAADEATHIGAQAAAKQADIDATTAVNQHLYDGEQPYMALKGEAAVQAAPAALQAVRQAHQDATADLDPVAKTMLAPVFDARAAGWSADITRHAAQQKQAALDATSQARQDMAMAEFNRYAGIDPARAALNLHAALSEIQTRAERNGLDGAMIEQARAEAAGQAWSGAVRGAIDRRDLGMARSLLDQGASHFDATVSQGLTRDLDQVQVEGEASQVAKGVLDARPAGAADLDAVVGEARARAGGDPMRQQAYGDATAAEFHRRQLIARDQRRGAIDAVVAQLDAPGVHAVADIPPAVLASAPPETRQAVAAYFAGGGHPAVSDPGARSQLSAMAAHDPAAFADLDATQWATRLDRDDYGRLLTDVKAMRAGGPPAQALQQLHAQLTSTSGQLVADTPVLAADPAAADRFQAALQRRAELAQSANPAKPLSDDDVARMGDGLLMSGAWQVGTGGRGPASESRDGLLTAMPQTHSDDAGRPQLIRTSYETTDAEAGGAEAEDEAGDSGGAAEGVGGEDADEAEAGEGVGGGLEDGEGGGGEGEGHGGAAPEAGHVPHASAHMKPIGPKHGHSHSTQKEKLSPEQLAAADAARAEIDTLSPIMGRDAARQLVLLKLLDSTTGKIGPKRTGQLADVAVEVWNAALKYGYPPLDAVVTAYHESTLNPKAPGGLFQWTKPRWAKLGGNPADEYKVDAQVAMLAAQEGGLKRAKLAEAMGSAERWAFYMRHQQGRDGVTALMHASPDDSAAQVLSRFHGPQGADNVIQRNIPHIIYAALGENMTVGEFRAVMQAQDAQIEIQVRQMLKSKGINLSQ